MTHFELDGIEQEDEPPQNLLDLVRSAVLGTDGVVNALLGVNDLTLLSLVGIKPTALIGCSVEGSADGFQISGKNYIGGFVGILDGSKIVSSDEFKTYGQSTDLRQQTLFHDWEKTCEKASGYEVKYTLPETSVTNSLLNLTAVSGAKYIGGIIGEGSLASSADVLGEIVGLGDYMSPEVTDFIAKFIP